MGMLTPNLRAGTKMIDDTIRKLEDSIRTARSLRPETKSELLDLFSTLKGEVSNLSTVDKDKAQAIAGHTQRSAREATGEPPNRDNLKVALDDLSSSVEGFEKSHPRLVEIVNRICTTLSNIGV